jgi:hypothetical protein
MCLVSLDDPGLTVFPTHRLLDGLKDPEVQERLGRTLRELFDIEEVTEDELRPATRPPARRSSSATWTATSSGPSGSRSRTRGGRPRAGVHAARLPRAGHRRARGARADGPRRPDGGRHLAPAGLGYSRTDAEAVELVRSGRYDAGFFLRSIPVAQVREVAAEGVTMPPKSTFFFPKVPTGLLFHPLE